MNTTVTFTRSLSMIDPKALEAAVRAALASYKATLELCDDYAPTAGKGTALKALINDTREMAENIPALALLVLAGAARIKELEVEALALMEMHDVATQGEAPDAALGLALWRQMRKNHDA